MDISALQTAVRDTGIFFTEHAIRRMLERRITVDEIENVVLSGEIIEEYPEDKYGPSCLICGITEESRPLHVVCSLPPRVRVITVYEPDPDEWIEQRYRRVK